VKVRVASCTDHFLPAVHAINLASGGDRNRWKRNVLFYSTGEQVRGLRLEDTPETDEPIGSGLLRLQRASARFELRPCEHIVV